MLIATLVIIASIATARWRILEANYRRDQALAEAVRQWHRAEHAEQKAERALAHAWRIAEAASAQQRYFSSSTVRHLPDVTIEITVRSR